MQELHKRLHAYYQAADENGDGGGEGPLRMTFEDALPMEDFFEVVDHHFEIRLRMAELRKSLEDRAVQFRNIEKRLLMRFKVLGGGGIGKECGYMSLASPSLMMEAACIDIFRSLVLMP